MCNCLKTYVVRYQEGRNSGRVYELSFRSRDPKIVEKIVNKKLHKKSFRIISITEKS